MFRKIMVANRGEVAQRVISTCRKMGVACVAIYSEADQDLQYLSGADEAVCVGGTRSYLDMDAIIQAARDTHCSAIHPGWGFLSENPTFAARVEALGITFIGPKSRSMRQMSDKAVARSTMRSLGLLPIPGDDRATIDVDVAQERAKAVGYPLLLKAVSGGGGRGMRRVYSPSEFNDAFMAGSAEANSAFGDPSMYMERLIEGGRHIEFQILSDGDSVAVLGERECSVQRRHQKLIEETPSVAVSDAKRVELTNQIQQTVLALGYRGAGTVEMLRDQDGEIYFMEMNTRLQVEHTITEETWGVDLVAEQLKIAANQPLQLDLTPRGHAIQCRINAEDVAAGFKPHPGRITQLVWPEINGLRVDTHLKEGDKVSPHYDSMIAKLICLGKDRQEAIDKMKQALSGAVVKGVPTTMGFHHKTLSHPQFQAGDYDTRFVEENLQELVQ